MNRKASLYAVIGGVVGAVLTMTVGLFLPQTAQSQSDAVFGKITCKELEVVDSDTGNVKVLLGYRGGTGFISLKGKPSSGLFIQTAGVYIDASEKHAGVRCYSPKGDVEIGVGLDPGGFVLIHDEIKFPPEYSPFARVRIGLDEYGNGEVVTRDKISLEKLK